MAFAAKVKQKIISIGLDFAAAFESTSRKYIMELLGMMGIGNIFCGWIGLLWSDMCGIISYDDIIQKEIPMTNRLTQGVLNLHFSSILHLSH